MKQRLIELVSMMFADRRKAGTLGALMLALLILAGRSFLSLGPESSSASDGDGNPDSITARGQSALARTFELLNRMQNGQVTEVPRSPRLSRDLFGVDDRVFPPPEPVVQLVEVITETIEPVVESPVEDADEVMARKVARIHAAAEGLRLRSVMVGQNPLVVFEIERGKRSVIPLNGMIFGFEVKEVTTKSVVVEMEAVQVRLWLTVPQR